MQREDLHNSVLKRSTRNLEIIYRLARQEDLVKLEWGGEYIHFRKVFQFTFHEQRMGRRLMLLAEFNHYPIGQMFVRVREEQYLFSNSNHRGYLYSFRVMQPFQGLGLGTELIDLAENILRDYHKTESHISVAKENPRAQQLYERLGYEVYGEDNGNWSYTDHKGRIVEVTEPAWLLAKSL